MQTRRLIAVIVAAGLITTVMPTVSHAAKRAKKPATAHKADPNITFIRQAYAYQTSGVEELDINVATSYTTADFFVIGKDGRRMSKSEATNELYSAFKQAAQANATIRVRQKIKQLSISQNTATVIVAAHVWLQVPSSDPSQLPRQADLSGGTTRDIWVRTPHGWDQQSSQWISDAE